MTKINDYRRALRELDEWEPFLLDESGLPGPRGNIELGQAVADEGSPELFERLLAWTPERAPVGSREEFLALCGTVGLGRLAAEGDRAGSANWPFDPDEARLGLALTAHRRQHTVDTT